MNIMVYLKLYFEDLLVKQNLNPAHILCDNVHLSSIVMCFLDYSVTDVYISNR